MKTTKMNLANIQGKLSRAEMKKIMGGSGTTCSGSCYKWNGHMMDYGTCSLVWNQVGNVRLQSCDCSLSGGSGCA